MSTISSTLQKEETNQKISMGVTVTIHALILLLIFLMSFFQDPYPANPGPIGVEVNFGTTDAGMGDPSNENGVVSDNFEEANPNDPAYSEKQDPIAENTPVENNISPEKTDKLFTSTAESPITAKDKEEANKPKPQVKTTATAPKPETTPKDQSGANGKNGSSSQAATSSNGNTNTQGNQGQLNGAINDKAIYSGTPGNGGGGGGPKLNMAGWNWDDVPDKVDPSSEQGYVVFEFQVDENGIVEWSRAIEKTVSPSVVSFYKKQLDNVTFSRKGNIVNRKGTVRFEVKAK